jgi:hypothetical protein
VRGPCEWGRHFGEGGTGSPRREQGASVERKNIFVWGKKFLRIVEQDFLITGAIVSIGSFEYKN